MHVCGKSSTRDDCFEKNVKRAWKKVELPNHE